jgi:sugar/nucleoside kinase (ribokinase family)
VVGHVTKDIVTVGQTTKTMPGGTAYYTSVASKSLGLHVAVVTKGAPSDRDSRLKELWANKVAVLERRGESTSVFENIYGGDDLIFRTQVLRSVGTPFVRLDVEGIRARAFHLGPLVRSDIPLEVLEQISTEAEIVSLDVQGMVRPPRMGQVTEEDWPDKENWLASVRVLKADELEARILSGEEDMECAASLLSSLGPKELLITLGQRGSLVFAEGIVHHIPSWRPTKLEDPTGCGDTYMAGYLYERLRGTPPDRAAMFAAAMSTLKLEGPGPFKGSEEDVMARLSSFPISL